MRSFAVAINKPHAILVIAGAIFACFAVYAFLSPTTYETSTLVLVETAEGADIESNMAPEAAAAKVREAVFKSPKLKTNLPPSDKQAAPFQTIAANAEFETKDARTFMVTYRAGDAERAREVCNLLARIAVEEAPRVLDPPKLTKPQAQELAREKRLEELAAFVAAHPELTSETPVAQPDSEGNREPDTLLLKLQAERRMIDETLVKKRANANSDNPYVELPIEGPDAETLQRRRREVNEAIAERRKALEGKPTTNPPKTQKLAPELQAEWKAKLRALAKADEEPTAADTQPQVLSARLLGEAPLPKSPVVPNRPIVLLLGALSSAIVALALWGYKTSLQRRASDRPLPTALSPSTDPPSRAPEARMGDEEEEEDDDRGIHPAQPEPDAPDRRSSSPPEAGQRRGRNLPARQAVITQPQGTEARVAGSADEPGEERDVPRRNRARYHQRFASTQISGSPPSARSAWRSSPAVHGNEREPSDAEANRSNLASEESNTAIPSHDEASPVRAERSVVLARSTQDRASDDRPPQTRRFVDNTPVTETAGRWDTEHVPEQPKASTRRVMNVGGEQTSSLDRPIPSEGRRYPLRRRGTMPLGSAATGEDESEEESPRDQSRTVNAASNRPETSYRFRSSAPPPSPTPPPPIEDHSVVNVYDVPPRWRPDASLHPEARRQLGNQLFPYAVERCFCLLVTSLPSMRTAKSKIAAEVALALSETGHPRILLMEGNFHRPNVHRLMQIDVPLSCGYSQQIHARVHGEVGHSWTVVGCSGSLHVLAEGAMRSPGILLSKQFERSLQDLKTYYDIIVIDGPVASDDVDCRALDSAADGLLMVGDDPYSPKVEEAFAYFGEKRFTTIVNS